MAYIVTNTAGNAVAVINDGTVDTTSTSLSLIGIDYNNYSQAIANDFIALMENFANTVQPRKPMVGQLWYNTQTKTLQVYSGTTFNAVNAVTSTVNTPIYNQIGDLWFNPTTMQLNYWNGGSWTVIAPLYTNAQGKAGFISATISDQTNVAHTVLELWLNDVLIAILNTDGPFTPALQISGFNVIESGLNLQTGFTLTGTVSNSSMANSLSPTADALYVHTYGPNSINGSMALSGTLSIGNIFITDNGTPTVSTEDSFTITTPGNVTVNALSLSTSNLTATNVSAATVTSSSYAFPTANTAITATTENYSTQNIAVIINDHNTITINSDGSINVFGSIAITGNLIANGGGTINAPIAATYSPTEPTDLVNKVYVDYSMPKGSIIQFYGDISTVTDMWAVCDGTNGTPDLRDKFVIGAGLSYTLGEQTGANIQSSTTLAGGNHNHGGVTQDAGAHNHNSHTGVYQLTVNDIPEHVHMYLNTVALMPDSSANNTNFVNSFQYPYQPDLTVTQYPGIQNVAGSPQFPAFNTTGTNTLFHNTLYDANGTRMRFYGNLDYLTYWGAGYPDYFWPYDWRVYPIDWAQNTSTSLDVVCASYPTGFTGGNLNSHNHSISTDGDHVHTISTTSDGTHQHDFTFDNKPLCVALVYIMKIV